MVDLVGFALKLIVVQLLSEVSEMQVYADSTTYLSESNMQLMNGEIIRVAVLNVRLFVYPLIVYRLIYFIVSNNS